MFLVVTTMGVLLKMGARLAFNIVRPCRNLI